MCVFDRLSWKLTNILQKNWKLFCAFASNVLNKDLFCKSIKIITTVVIINLQLLSSFYLNTPFVQLRKKTEAKSTVIFGTKKKKRKTILGNCHGIQKFRNIKNILHNYETRKTAKYFFYKTKKKINEWEINCKWTKIKSEEATTDNREIQPKTHSSEHLLVKK